MMAAVGMLGCEGKDAAWGLPGVAFVDHARDGARGPAGERGARGEKGDTGPAGKGADSLDGARLKARYIVGEDGSRERSGDWLDTETEEPCRWAKATDGELRCLPGEPESEYSPASQIRYLDSACAQPILLAYSADVPGYITSFYQSGDPVYIKVGAALMPANVYSLAADGTCVPFNNPGNYHWYTVDIVPPSDFVAGAVSVD